MSRRKTVKMAVGIILIVSLGVSLRGCLPPSQQSLTRRFARGRESLEKIRVMLEEDHAIAGVASYGLLDPRTDVFCRPQKIGFPAQRWREYRALLRKAGVRSVLRDKEEIRFFVAGWGFASYGWRVAFVYRDTEPRNIIASLREFRRGPTAVNPNWAYCRVAPNWYIWIIW